MLGPPVWGNRSGMLGTIWVMFSGLERFMVGTGGILFWGPERFCVRWGAIFPGLGRFLARYRATVRRTHGLNIWLGSLWARISGGSISCLLARRKQLGSNVACILRGSARRGETRISSGVCVGSRLQAGVQRFGSYRRMYRHLTTSLRLV